MTARDVLTVVGGAAFLCALAVPAFGRARPELHVQTAATRLGDLFVQARARAIGRGRPTVIEIGVGAPPLSFLLYEGECARTPKDAPPLQGLDVEEYAPGEGVQTTWRASPTSGIAASTILLMCFDAAGRARRVLVGGGEVNDDLAIEFAFIARGRTLASRSVALPPPGGGPEDTRACASGGQVP